MIEKIVDGGRCFVLGCGPQLSEIDKNTIEKLKNETTIGTNTSHYKFWPSIWYGVHAAQLFMYYRHKRRCLDRGEDIKTRGMFQISRPLEKVAENEWILPSYHSLLGVEKVEYHRSIAMRRRDTFSRKIIYSSPTVSVIATEIAVMLGFDEIYLIGVQMNSWEHFFSGDEKTYQEVLQDARAFQALSPIFNRKNVEMEHLTRLLMTDAENLTFFRSREILAEKNTINSFKKLIEDYGGISMYNTTRDSVLYGKIPFRSLSELFCNTKEEFR